jgi:hypothetical protein
MSAAVLWQHVFQAVVCVLSSQTEAWVECHMTTYLVTVSQPNACGN